jgi:CRISPR-associated endonuclease Csn1
LPVRVRINDAAQDESDKSGKTYAFYPDRSLLEAEFEAIWSAQEPYHPAILSPACRDLLRRVIFYQRPLKDPEIGLCTLLGPQTGERRLPKSDPLFQQRRLLEELNHLAIDRGPGVPVERLTRDSGTGGIVSGTGVEKVNSEA